MKAVMYTFRVGVIGLISLFIPIATLAQPRPFITVWETKADGDSITIPTAPGEVYNYTVDWGDKSLTTTHTADATHSYAKAGKHTVTITWQFPRIDFSDHPVHSRPPSGKKRGESRVKILEVSQWGTQVWTSMAGAFYACANLKVTASDQPDLSKVKDMSAMFYGASAFNQPLNGWDVSNVTNMESMFYGASAFNQPLNDWNVSGVTSMSFMFSGARAFNQPLDDWNVSGVTSMSFMFSDARAFNQDISGWDVSGVTNMSSMFYGARAFNQPLDDWNVSGVTNMSSMFYDARGFNQDISGWDVSAVTAPLRNFFGQSGSMLGMFRDARAFSAENYTRLLIGWAKLPVKRDVAFGAPAVGYYCAAKAAREKLVDKHGYDWDITGDLKMIGISPSRPNKAPKFSTAPTLTTPPAGAAPITLSLPRQDNHEVGKFEATDPNKDELRLTLVAKGYNPANYGFSLDTVYNIGRDSVTATLRWDTDCRKFPFHIKNDFALRVELEDKDVCREVNTKTIAYQLKTIITNQKPTIATTLPAHRFEVEVFQPAPSFTVTAEDRDGDPILLQGVGKTVSLNDLGATFPDRTVDGSVSTDFTFDASCRNLRRLKVKGDTRYVLQFIAKDQGSCTHPDAAVLDVVLKIKVPPNQAPAFGSKPQTHEVSIQDEPFTLRLTAEDADADSVTLSLLPGETLPPSGTFHFPRVRSKAQATATLTWQPECSLLGEDFSPKDYTVRFLSKDHHCIDPLADTLALAFRVKQRVAAFRPANAFSPNGDGINDTFKLHGHHDPVYNLPKNCRHGAFRSVLIMNRAGQKVYRSSDRDFEWDSEGVDSGVYYYHIEYETKSYQGVLHVLR